MGEFSDEEKENIASKLNAILSELKCTIHADGDAQSGIVAQTAYENLTFLKSGLGGDKHEWYAKCQNIIDSGERNNDKWLSPALAEKLHDLQSH